MMSDNDKKILENIRDSVEKIRSNVNLANLRFIYSKVSDIIRGSEKLENINLGKTIKAEATKIMQTSNIDEVIECLDNISVFISKEENETEKTKVYLDVTGTKPSQSHRFLSDLKSYRSFSNNIEELQARILASPVYQKKLHEIIDHGRWNGYRHAHITKNLRLMYIYDPAKKLIIWEAIVHHKEIDVKK